MQHLLFLHGAIGGSDQLMPLSKALSADFSVHNLDFPGHAGKAMPAAFSIPLFSTYVKDYCDQHALKQVSVFGYSMGGYVGMYLAKQHPALVRKLATLATKFHWNEETAAREIKMLQPAVIEQKLPLFAQA